MKSRYAPVRETSIIVEHKPLGDHTMSDFLLLLSIGPVQEFIAAARRTADLHAGSHLLECVVDAAAKTLPDPPPSGWGVGRVFPADTGNGGANKLLAIVTSPEVAAQEAEAAARGVLMDAWNDAIKLLPGGATTFLGADQAARALRQIEGFLEFYSVWLPVTKDDYEQTRQTCEAVLAATKAVRAFPQQPGDDAQIASSALDPTRPNVVAGRRVNAVPVSLRDRFPLWLKATELLDAVSLVKRALSIGPEDSHQLGLGAVLSTRDLAQRAVDPDYHSVEETEPGYTYFAILSADGDHMGARLSALATPDQHRVFSRTLDEFARAAKDVVNNHHGQLVYAGGDDVLAFLPVPFVLGCATELAEQFAAVTGGTLSAGVAIVHYKEPLSLGLRRARAAEATAKITRNALAVALYKRGGTPTVYSESWPSAGQHQLLSVWVAHHAAGKVTRSLGYSLRELATRLPPEIDPGVLNAEVRRVVEHSGSDKSVRDDLPDLKSLAELGNFITMLLVARFLTEKPQGQHQAGQPIAVPGGAEHA